MLIFIAIIAILIAATVMLFLFLKRHPASNVAGFVAEMAIREIERRRLIKSLVDQPQSGFWFNCMTHGNMPLTKDEYDKQTRAEAYKCPFCGVIPRKIWRQP